VRAAAIALLGALRGHARAAVPALLDALKSPTDWIRQRALHALGTIGDPSAVSAIVTALEDPSHFVRDNAVDALRDLGPKAEAAVPALTRVLLNDPKASVRRSVILALERIGPAALAAEPELRQALGDHEPEVRWLMAATLAILGTEDSASLLPLLVEAAIRTDNTLVGHEVSRAFHFLGAERSAPAATLILEALESGDPDALRSEEYLRWLLETRLSPRANGSRTPAADGLCQHSDADEHGRHQHDEHRVPDCRVPEQPAPRARRSRGTHSGLPRSASGAMNT
jgi:HEAT repeat protein